MKRHKLNSYIGEAKLGTINILYETLYLGQQLVLKILRLSRLSRQYAVQQELLSKKHFTDLIKYNFP